MAYDSAADNDVRMDMGALWFAIRRRWLRILLVTAVLAGGAYALLLFVPKSYDSTASILVENRDSVYTRPANEPAGSTTLSADDLSTIISSQMQLIQSRDTLLDVVRSQKLAAVPEFNATGSSPFGFLTRFFKKPSTVSAEDAALDTLAGHLTVIRERDSALISVIVRSTDPQRAAALANAIAAADVARRAGLSFADTVDASKGLEQQIAQMRQRVADEESKVANFKVDNDLFTGANNTSLLDQQMSDLSNQITASQGRKNTAQSRATLIRGLLAAGQPIDGVEDVRNSVTIQQLITQKGQLTTQRAQLLATLLPSHPSVEAVTAQIVEVDKQIGIEGRRVADALLAEAKIEDSLQTSIEANLTALKAKAANATKQGVTLDALSRQATADRDLLASYLTRYGDAASRTDANAALPDVRVVTLAAPSDSPSSPKAPLIVGAVAFIALALQIGGVLFGELLSGRALTGSGMRPAVEAQEPIEPAEPAPLEDIAEPPEEPVYAEPEELPRVIETPLPPAAPRSGRFGLRSWFAKRARAVGATLTAYEPPMQALQANAASPIADHPSPDEFDPAFDPDESEMHESEIDDETDEVQGFDAANEQRLADLSADLILGRARIILLAAVADPGDAEQLAERLIADALHRGVSVARVDAGSGRPSTEPGITDLSAERAAFGDVVHRTSDDGFAEIPWGHLTTLDRRSTRPITLVEALSEIYEVVIVLTGRIGMASSLPVFAGLQGRLVVVPASDGDPDIAEAARADLAAVGFDASEVIGVPPRQAEVA
jgi:succinoglycan biosynthesis transport protein ExoP